MDKKIKPIFDEREEAKRKRKNSREEIKQNLLVQKEREEIRRTELNFIQKIVVNVVGFFTDSDKLKNKLKKQNYKDNIEKGIVPRPKVLDAEVDRKEEELVRKRLSTASANTKTRTKNTDSPLQSLKDISTKSREKYVS
jgi:hypothetical protein